MRVVRGSQSNTHREWTVIAENGTPEKPAKKWRVTCYWSIGSLRMEWLVEVYISPPQHTSYWRRVNGLDAIGAVREFENDFERMNA